MTQSTQSPSDTIRVGLIGAGIAAALLLIGGSFWPGWSLESTVKKRLADQERTTIVRLMGPVCAEKFRAQPDVQVKAAALKAVNTWQRENDPLVQAFVMKTGSPYDDRAIGAECVRRLEDILK